MKRIALIFALLVFISSNAFTQENEPVIYRIVEVMPEYPGGSKELMNYIVQNVIYPPSAVEENIQGIVYVQFVINEEGEVKDVKVVDGAHETLDAEALRVIQGMPAWNPGQQRGKNVSVYFTVPVRFKLSGPEKKSPKAPKKSRDRN